MKAGRIVKKLIYPVFIPMQGCPHRCIYCDQSKISGAGDIELAAQLEAAREFIRRHPGEAKEIAFYGGSFTALSPERQQCLAESVLGVADAQTSLRISTHPLYINADILDNCQHLRISCIELGVQDFADEVLKASGRGYSSELSLKACQLVKQHGFLLGVQLMPGLPGSNNDTIRINMQFLRLLKPDYLRLYPLIVIKGTPLEELYRQGKYQPLELEAAIELCADYAQLCETEGIILIKAGLPSNLNESDIVCGPWHPAFGEFVMAERLIRQILEQAKTSLQIKLDKKQRALIMAHGGRAKAILEKRLENCCLNPEQAFASFL